VALGTRKEPGAMGLDSIACIGPRETQRDELRRSWRTR